MVLTVSPRVLNNNIGDSVREGGGGGGGGNSIYPRLKLTFLFFLFAEL